MKSRNSVIMNHFPPEHSWEENYKTIIQLGKNLPLFEEVDREDKWRIRACQSPLWLKVESNERGELIFTGDSEAQISKGLLALAIEFYSGREPEEILKDSPRFIKNLHFDQFLTSQRTNGFQALLEQILQYARAFLAISSVSKKK